MRWRRWAQKGWLDYYAGQAYTPDPRMFQRRARNVIEELGKSCPAVVGIGIKWGGGETDVDTVIREIEVARKLGAAGVAIFSGKDLTEAHAAALKAGPFREPAPYPALSARRGL